MAETNYDPNARYDMGPNAAGCGRVPVSADQNDDTKGLSYPRSPGLESDSVLANANLRVGFNAAGMPRNNTGPNVAGAPRSINGV